jgi:hypothetical protein
LEVDIGVLIGVHLPPQPIFKVPVIVDVVDVDDVGIEFIV